MDSLTPRTTFHDAVARASSPAGPTRRPAGCSSWQRDAVGTRSRDDYATNWFRKNQIQPRRSGVFRWCRSWRSLRFFGSGFLQRCQPERAWNSCQFV